MKSKNTSISFYCFLASIVVFILGNIMGKIYYETGFTLGIGSGWLGYVFLASIFIIPLVGVIFGFNGEKSRLKYVSIAANLLVCLTVGALSVALIVYDFVPQ
ncbi:MULTISPECIES: hypothetical protein [Bacillota]|uniref:hypothetical protein n=1 Tax=Bacillota TaxID=1239 RepID=UPI00155F7F0E|nr:MULTISPECIES: hypothetical protein [Bacillota]NRG29473.1 hypothetical protein [Niallia circulans]